MKSLLCFEIAIGGRSMNPLPVTEENAEWEWGGCWEEIVDN